MPTRRHLLRAVAAGPLIAAAGAFFPGSLVARPATSARRSIRAWPIITAAHRPWTYWWWMGSAVNRRELSRQLRAQAAVGLGGVHIIPIYGARGHDAQYLSFLTPRWVSAVRHTADEGRRLGLGVDLTTGTGWPFGGPSVGKDEGARRLLFEAYELAGGSRLDLEVRSTQQPEAPLAALTASSSGGSRMGLGHLVGADRKLDWTAPAGTWRLDALFAGWTGQKVKRAAPGGEGLVVDHLSAPAVQSYLTGFERAFGKPPRGLRAMYADSYEVFGADWTPGLVEAFQQRHGYALPLYARELRGVGDRDTIARVRRDFRETVSTLLLESFARPWTTWARERGWQTRYEAHGAPANMLDLYAEADSPEAEAFGPSHFPIPGLRTETRLAPEYGRPDPIVIRLASSAAHLAGRARTSCETATWLGEHFQVGPAQVKPELDALFAAGVNHVFFHGTTYSPREARWPGWLFYASTDFGPEGGLWQALPSISAYVARCQAVLTAGRPDNDLLLYLPMDELWQTAAGESPLRWFTAHNATEWLGGTSFDASARHLRRSGIGFDYVSDRLLEGLTVREREIHSRGESRYVAALVPHCTLMKPETMERLLALAEAGATVLFQDGLPTDVPGLGALEVRRGRLRTAVARLGAAVQEGALLRHRLGAGTVLVGTLPDLLAAAPVAPENMASDDVVMIRRAVDDGHHYFVANLGATAVRRWVRLGRPARAVALQDPLTGRTGRARTRASNEAGPGRARAAGREGTAFLLELEPGESLLVRTFAGAGAPGSPWPHVAPAGTPSVEIAGPWSIRFLSGGPVLPPAVSASPLVSWPDLGAAAAVFFGTARYRTSFTVPAGATTGWRLELGAVHDTAVVRVNGRRAGTVWSRPTRLDVSGLVRPGRNLLEIDITNLPANRIAHLARSGEKWADFHDINFVDIKYKPFDASKWPPFPSGLLGPVRLVSLQPREDGPGG